MADLEPSTRARPRTTDTSDPRHQADAGSIGDVIATVKEYARQETLAPLKGAARWLAFGTAAAIMLGIGSSLLVLGVLRLVQQEFAPTFSGRWMSLLPYAIAIVGALIVVGLAVSRISKKSLQKSEQ